MAGRGTPLSQIAGVFKATGAIMHDDAAVERPDEQLVLLFFTPARAEVMGQQEAGSEFFEARTAEPVAMEKRP